MLKKFVLISRWNLPSHINHCPYQVLPWTRYALMSRLHSFRIWVSASMSSPPLDSCMFWNNLCNYFVKHVCPLEWRVKEANTQLLFITEPYLLTTFKTFFFHLSWTHCWSAAGQLKEWGNTFFFRLFALNCRRRPAEWKSFRKKTPKITFFSLNWTAGVAAPNGKKKGYETGCTHSRTELKPRRSRPRRSPMSWQKVSRSRRQ